MTEHKFTTDEVARIMKVVGEKTKGNFETSDEIQLAAIIHEVLTKQTENEAKDTLIKAKEVVRRLEVAIKEKSLANTLKREVDKYIEAVNILHPNEAKLYRVDAKRKAGESVGEIKVYKNNTLLQHTQVNLEGINR